jgi:hypothetical protein
MSFLSWPCAFFFFEEGQEEEVLLRKEELLHYCNDSCKMLQRVTERKRCATQQVALCSNAAGLIFIIILSFTPHLLLHRLLTLFTLLKNNGNMSLKRVKIIRFSGIIPVHLQTLKFT